MIDRRMGNPAYVIRSGRADEADALREIERAAGQAFATVGYPDVAAHEATAAEDLHHAACEGLLLVAADAAGGPAGFLFAGEADHNLYIRELAVHPDHAGNRLAVSLFATAEGIARRRNLQALTLTTFREVPWNAPYYARLGFSEMVPEEIGPELAVIIEQQRCAGLDISRRVAMRRVII